MVNNAGVSTFGEVEFTSMDTYKQVSEVNLWGTIRVTKAVLPFIRRAKGERLENKQHTSTQLGVKEFPQGGGGVNLQHTFRS